VIAAFNKDKPYDEFVREQIAGDLLPHKDEADRWEKLIATGYIASSRRFGVQKQIFMAYTFDDSIENLGTAFLGLSIGCARCHDHKFDPISHADYYALYGIFESTRYPFAGLETNQKQEDLVPRLPQAEIDKLMKPLEPLLAPIDAKLKELQEEMRQYMARQRAKQSGQPAPADAPPLRDPSLIKRDLNLWQAKREEALARMPPIEMAFAVAEATPKDARLLLRGERENPGEPVPRRFLEILGGHGVASPRTTSGRLDLASWLTGGANPLTARVMVNRIWQHHFGKGLVATPNDFGSRGSAPSHPELLDYLAVTFRESGWSIKAMHRLMVLSDAYQRSSRPTPEQAAVNRAKDPDNEMLWRFNRRRLDAESLRDSLLQFSGDLSLTRPGEHPFPKPATWKFTQHRPFVAVYESQHRSVYMMTQRIQRHPYLAMFDGADTNASTPARTVTISPLQALFLMNGELAHRTADRFAGRLLSEFGSSRLRLDWAHRVVLGRPAMPEEIAKAEEHLHKSRMALVKTELPESQHNRQALASYLRGLLSSNEFMFVD
ncbi:MAG: DUF1549 and DUF1553 domain-containing protein, partial [Phycisphaerales bacterium]|nr:DUF1549 and DUF1553 domain-containing protein [Phycisphaerales bacterium]